MHYELEFSKQYSYAASSNLSFYLFIFFIPQAVGGKQFTKQERCAPFLLFIHAAAAECSALNSQFMSEPVTPPGCGCVFCVWWVAVAP